MLKDPKLNKNKDTATYGMSAQIPDGALLNEFVAIHTGCLLDCLKYPKNKK